MKDLKYIDKISYSFLEKLIEKDQMVVVDTCFYIKKTNYSLSFVGYFFKDGENKILFFPSNPPTLGKEVYDQVRNPFNIKNMWLKH